MRINCQKEELLYGVSSVVKAVSTKNTLPILGGILITAKDNIVTLRATDLEMAIECTVSADVPEGGAVVVPGRYFIELVRHLPDTMIGLESADGQTLAIYYEQSQINVRCFDVNEFPALPQVDGEIKRQIPAPLFRKIVKQSTIAAASDEIRPIFTGVLMEIGAEKLTAVTTDTHRMAVCEITCSGEGEGRVIIPCRNITEMARLATNDDEPVFITVDRNQVYFNTGNITFFSRVISGQFPDYKQVIPAPSMFSTQAVIKRGKLLEALERASLLSRDQARTRGNVIKVQILNEVLFISADSPDVGKIREEMPISLEGKELESSYNVRYLIEALKVIDEDNIILRLTGATTPGVIVPEKETSYLYLILPLRITN